MSIGWQPCRSFPSLGVLTGMSALDLVAQYSSDSDGEVADIPEKLPLPALITNNTKNSNYIDNPEEHGGRIRSFPHERGNWPTFVYVPCTFDEKFNHIIGELLEECSNFGFKLVDDYHISVSKTVILKYHWIECFISSLKEVLGDFTRFVATFNSLAIFCNDDNTRTFLGLKIDDDQTAGFNNIVNKTDSVLTDFKLQTFYKDPSFHVSLLWCVGNKKDILTKLLPKLEKILHSYINEASMLFENDIIVTSVDVLHCKIGNKLYSFFLKNE